MTGMSSVLTAADMSTEQLWAEPDGTVCTLSKRETPPYYVVSLIRNACVLRERRLYGLASAQMLAQGWRELRVPEAIAS
jgi:hypothetical protein